MGTDQGCPTPSSRNARLLALALAAASLFVMVGCKKSASTTSPLPVATLPTGSLVAFVPQPQDVPTGMIPLLQQTGPADLTRLSSFSSNPTSTKASLIKHGFEEGYVAEYADLPNGRSITVVVTRFASAAGAGADITDDLAAKLPTSGHAVIVPLIGDQAGGVSQPLPNGPKGAELVTIRFRVGELTWLVAVGSNGAVDVTAVSGIASNLAARAETLATASPSASPS